MPFYKELKYINASERLHVCGRLTDLRKGLAGSIPRKTVHDTLLLATWNIREFGPSNKGGERLNESYYYLAEIISKFDIVAVQEVRDDLTAIHKLMRILGSRWDFIATDTVLGTSGNYERLAFLYDSSKVSFTGIAGEIVLADNRLMNKKQFARTPFTVSFQSGWFKFVITTVHIYYGTDTGTKLQRRIDEIAAIVDTLDKRIKADNENTYIVLGDFNIISPEHQTMKALKSKKFTVSKKLEALPSNFKKDKHYDQIAFKTSSGRIEFSDNGNSAGVFDYSNHVFTPKDETYYKNSIKKGMKYKEWVTFQMSDHLPMWVELKIDFSDYYLQYLQQYKG